MKILINVKAYLKDGNCIINHNVECENTHTALAEILGKEQKEAYMKARVVRIVFDIAFPQY